MMLKPTISSYRKRVDGGTRKIEMWYQGYLVKAFTNHRAKGMERVEKGGRQPHVLGGAN